MSQLAVRSLQQVAVEDFTKFHVNFQYILNIQDTKARRAELRRMLFFQPFNDLIYYLIAMSYLAEHRIEDAKSYFMVALHHNPRNVDSYLDMSVCLENDETSAIMLLEKALKFAPDHIRLKSVLGVFYLKSNRFDAADNLLIPCMDQCTDEFKINNYLNMSFLGERYDEEPSIAYLKKAIEISGENPLPLAMFQSHMLKAKYRCPPAIEADETKVNEYFKDTPLLCEGPYVPDPNRKKRIGYLSYDFGAHVVMKFMYHILEHHSDKFEIVCISLCPREDLITTATKKLNTSNIRWANVSHMSDTDAAKYIKDELKIDILVDLGIHTCGNRMGIVAHKPAPIQVNYIGYPGFSGLKTMDYRIGDIRADSSETSLLNEKLVCFKNNFFLNYFHLNFIPNKNEFVDPWTIHNNCTCDSCVKTKIVKKSDDSEFMIGLLNKPPKNSPEFLDMVRRILDRIPGATVLIKIRHDNLNKAVEYFSSKLGVVSDRIKFASNHIENFYELPKAVDVVLDPFPYSGTTTTCDCLLMSAPVVSMRNAERGHVHNVTSSLLECIGHPELIVNSVDEYIEKIVELSQNRERVNEYKSGKLRDDFLNGISNNHESFMKEYEGLLDSLT